MNSGLRAPKASIVEQGQQAYGKHMLQGEDSMPTDLLNKFLKVQNGTDIRGVVIEGALPSGLVEVRLFLHWLPVHYQSLASVIACNPDCAKRLVAAALKMDRETMERAVLFSWFLILCHLLLTTARARIGKSCSCYNCLICIFDFQAAWQLHAQHTQNTVDGLQVASNRQGIKLSPSNAPAPELML
jgi:hypothetical protein